MRIIDGLGLLAIRGPEHDLVLVELAGLGVDLVNDESRCVLAITCEVDIDLFPVLTLAAPDVAVVRALHLDFPRRPVWTYARALRSLGVLDRDISRPA